MQQGLLEDKIRLFFLVQALNIYSLPGAGQVLQFVFSQTAFVETCLYTCIPLANVICKYLLAYGGAAGVFPSCLLVNFDPGQAGRL